MPYIDPEKQAAANRRSYLRNREKRLAYAKARHAANRVDNIVKMKMNRDAKREAYSSQKRQRWTEDADHRARSNAAGKAYRAANKLKIADLNRAWRKENDAAIRAKVKAKYAANRAARIEAVKQWARDNPERRKTRLAIWRSANPGYQAKRYRENPRIMVERRLRSRLAVALGRAMTGKAGRYRDFIGCDDVTLRRHIQEQFVDGMTWQITRIGT